MRVRVVDVTCQSCRAGYHRRPPIWEASDRVCGKRLKPLLPILVSALERHGHLALNSTVRVRVLSASAASPAALDGAIRLREQPAGTSQINRAVQSFGDGVETGRRT